MIMAQCVVIENEFQALPPGLWRAELDLTSPGVGLKSNPSDQFQMDNKLPFLFEVKYVNADSFFIEIINGEERIQVSDLTFGHNRANGRDSVKFHFPEYDSYVLAYFEEDILEGRWYVPARGNYSIPFLARHGKDQRFDFVEKNSQKWNAAGRWKVNFGIEDPSTQYPAIGEFKQNNEVVTGTFLTETGDYRFLEGKIIGDHLWLSCFDGSHAFLFKAKFTEENQLTGFFKSGNHYQTLWSAQRSEDVILRDPDSLTYSNSEVLTLQFSDHNGNVLDLDSETWANRPKIVQVLGTWCPNCKDETKFLVDYLSSTEHDVAVMGLAFEKAKNKEKAIQGIENYRRKLNIPYPIYYVGEANKEVASEFFSDLNAITSFPTLIFLNEQNEVVRIHTGFNGPATSEYDDFVRSFSETIQKMINHDQ